MAFSVFQYGRPMLTDLEDIEEAKRLALDFVASTETEFLEIRDSDNEPVTIGYFDGRRFHWTRDKGQTEAWRGLGFVTQSPRWRECSESEEREVK